MTREELLAPSEEPTEAFPLPRKGGEIRLKGITDIRDFDRMNQQIRLHSTAAERGFPPFAGYSKEEITRAHWLAQGILEPKLDVGDCLQLGRTLGPVVETILVRIADLSGMSLGAAEEREEALKATPFRLMVLHVCLETLHRHPSEVNLTLPQLFEIQAYLKIKRDEEEKQIRAGRSGEHMSGNGR